MQQHLPRGTCAGYTTKQRGFVRHREEEQYTAPSSARGPSHAVCSEAKVKWLLKVWPQWSEVTLMMQLLIHAEVRTSDMRAGQLTEHRKLAEAGSRQPVSVEEQPGVLTTHAWHCCALEAVLTWRRRHCARCQLRRHTSPALATGMTQSVGSQRWKGAMLFLYTEGPRTDIEWAWSSVHPERAPRWIDTRRRVAHVHVPLSPESDKSLKAQARATHFSSYRSGVRRSHSGSAPSSLGSWG